jgi:RND superfamily putative drug exporter
MSWLTSFVLRHKVIVIAFWLAAAVAGLLTISSTTSRLSVDFALPGQPGYVTDTKIAQLYHNGGGQQPLVVTATMPANVTAHSPQAAAQLARIFTAAGAAIPGSRVADEATTDDPHFSTADGKTSFALVFTPELGGPFAPDPSPRVGTAAAAAAPTGWHTGLTGLQLLAAGGSNSGGSSALAETLLGGVGAVLVLIYVFASFLALLPILMALIAIPTTFLLVGGLTYVTSVSVIVEFIIALIGLGVATDFSLLVVTRWREHRARGADNHTAVVAAMNTAGRAVAFSGLTVAISLLALLVLPVPFLRNIGAAGFFVPLVSLAVATTLLPVLLATIGPRLDWPRLRRETTASRTWTAWARLVVRFRKTAAVIGFAILAALLIPLAVIHIGEPTTPALAQSGPAHAALTQLTTRGVPSGMLAPIEVLTQADTATAVARRLTGIPGVYAAFAPDIPGYRAGATALVDVLPVDEPSTPRGAATITAVQNTLHHVPGVLGVGGAGAAQADFIHAVYGSFPLMLALICLFTFVLLARAFRSILLAVKAVVFNLLSVGAAYGVMVLVWQRGMGSHALWGVPATGSITVWVPIMVFAFLFGLSMDYEVFILSRMREEYDATGSTHAAIVIGIGRTGRLVTSAALILFLGFLAMSTAGKTDLRVMATGLGAGILLDAIVVRSLLVPALVGVLGRWNWWLPATAAKLLRVAPAPLPPAATQLRRTSTGREAITVSTAD